MHNFLHKKDLAITRSAKAKIQPLINDGGIHSHNAPRARGGDRDIHSHNAPRGRGDGRGIHSHNARRDGEY